MLFRLILLGQFIKEASLEYWAYNKILLFFVSRNLFSTLLNPVLLFAYKPGFIVTSIMYSLLKDNFSAAKFYY